MVIYISINIIENGVFVFDITNTVNPICLFLSGCSDIRHIKDILIDFSWKWAMLRNAVFLCVWHLNEIVYQK